jgi:alpha-glucuronidase|tara:strand:+ start:216 stop:572 length:357 start_codon:yes stop_codon:yes gene_type:complete
MQTSSPRFKSIAVTAGLSFWFFLITSSIGIFSIEILIIFITLVLSITQIFARKISKGLDIFAKINTKIFLGILFTTVISIYGIFFKLLRIDLLRLKKQETSYWLDVEQTKPERIRKQY